MSMFFVTHFKYLEQQILFSFREVKKTDPETSQFLKAPLIGRDIFSNAAKCPGTGRWGNTPMEQKTAGLQDAGQSGATMNFSDN